MAEYSDGFFHLEGFNSDGTSFPIPVDGVSSAEAGAAGTDADEGGAFDPSSVEDARERTLAAVARRRGQRAFRKTLLRLYAGRCAVSSSAVESVLEAAHVTPYRGPETNNPQNGILLRSDVHTLWDLGLLAIDPDTKCVVLSHLLHGTEYEHFSGMEVNMPATDAPSQEALESHRAWCGL